MKKIYSLVAGLLLTTIAVAQAPQKMSYQAVIRTSSNTLVTSAPVGMKVSILQGSATGAVVFIETHAPTTNANGLVSLEIGGGTAVTGTLGGIDWASGPYFVKTETDPTGGTSYTVTGTSQLMSVPYSLFSANGTPGPAGPQGPQGVQGVQGVQGLQGAQGVQGLIGLTGPAGAQGVQGIPGADGAQGIQGLTGIQGPEGNGFSNGTVTNQMMYWNGSAWITLNPGSNGQVLGFCGGALTWLTLAGVCSSALYPVGSVFCTSGPTAIVDVTNPATGKTWMDRNLGASQVAISSTDALAYGDLYQWGRRSDGHQCRTSPTTATLSSIDQPAHGNFILSSVSPPDWRSPKNDNLWQGVNGLNNPCPSGYRLPTESEINLERASWSTNDFIGAFNSPLKLSMGGDRYASNGVLSIVGQIGIYSTSTIASAQARYLYFFSGAAYMNSYHRGHGLTIRCIKD